MEPRDKKGFLISDILFMTSERSQSSATSRNHRMTTETSSSSSSSPTLSLLTSSSSSSSILSSSSSSFRSSLLTSSPTPFHSLTFLPNMFLPIFPSPQFYHGTPPQPLTSPWKPLTTRDGDFPQRRTKIWPIRELHSPASLGDVTTSRRKGGQVRFTCNQSTELEEKFGKQKYISPLDRKNMARCLGLSERQVKTWFQNRRAKWRRLKQEKFPQASGPISSDMDVTCQDVSQSETCSAMHDTIDAGNDECDETLGHLD